MAASIDDLLQGVQDESQLDDSIITLLGNIQQQLNNDTTIPAAVQAKIDAAFAVVSANKAKVAAAVASGTPAAPVTPGATSAAPTAPATPPTT